MFSLISVSVPLWISSSFCALPSSSSSLCKKFSVSLSVISLFLNVLLFPGRALFSVYWNLISGAFIALDSTLDLWPTMYARDLHVLKKTIQRTIFFHHNSKKCKSNSKKYSWKQDRLDTKDTTIRISPPGLLHLNKSILFNN